MGRSSPRPLTKAFAPWSTTKEHASLEALLAALRLGQTTLGFRPLYDSTPPAKRPLMLPTDWTDPEQRKEYFRAQGKRYRKTHRRVTVTFTAQDFEWIFRSAEHFGKPKIAKHVRDLALEAAKEGKSGERDSAIPKEDVDAMIMLLRNMANNLNQTARHLNEEALKSGARIVLGKEDSKSLLESLFFLLQGLEEELKNHLP